MRGDGGGQWDDGILTPHRTTHLAELELEAVLVKCRLIVSEQADVILQSEESHESQGSSNTRRARGQDGTAHLDLAQQLPALASLER